MNKDFITSDQEKFTIIVHLPGGDLTIGKKDIDISYFSEGPGGQNVNRHMSGVRLIYRIPEAHRMQSSKTREIVTRSINERKKERNLKHAFEQLADKLHRYFYIKPTRKKTKFSKKSKEKRLHDKKYQSFKKQGRQKMSGEV